MNDEPPSEFEPPPERPDSYEAPPFWLMFFLGLLLPIGAGFLCAAVRAPWPLAAGAMAAFVSLFFRGWRGIFTGSLLAVGLAVLVVIMICGSSHPSL